MKRYFRFFALMAGWLFVFTSLFAADSAKTPGISWIFRLGGTVNFQASGSADWKRPVLKMAVHEGDRFTTGGDGWVILAFENSSLIRIEKNSGVVINKARYLTSSKSLNASFGIPDSGELLAVIRKIAKKDNTVEVVTPTAVAGVRGTDLLVKSDPDSSTVAVFEGKVIVKDLVGEQGLSTDDNSMLADFLQDVLVGSGGVTTYQKGKGLSKPRPIGSDFQDEKSKIQSMKVQSKDLEKQFASGSLKDRSDSAEKTRTRALGQ